MNYNAYIEKGVDFIGKYPNKLLAGIFAFWALFHFSGGDFNFWHGDNNPFTPQ